MTGPERLDQEALSGSSHRLDSWVLSPEGFSDKVGARWNQFGGN